MLHCEDVNVQTLARRFGTPLYLYSYRTLIDHFQKLQAAFCSVHPLICFSVKANPNLALLRALVCRGAGLDIVSGGELFRALAAGCPSQRIVYASVGKTDAEIRQALRARILFFNVESLAELANINRIARRMRTIARVAIRINPDVEAKTHHYISTGKITNKFGIDLVSAGRIFSRQGAFPFLNICGLHIHIGSQITSSAPFVAALTKVAGFIESLRKTGVALEYLNIGGGLGIIYDRETPQTAKRYAEKIMPLLQGTGLKIIMEPGRFIVGNAGILVTKVLYIKATRRKTFVIVDSGMNDLIRPALYGAYHQILPLRKTARPLQKVDVVGPICESGDFFAKGRMLPKIREGEYLAIMSAGAYGFSMSSNYNSRCRSAEVLVDGNRMHLIRRRETQAELVRNECVPAFLKKAS